MIIYVLNQSQSSSQLPARHASYVDGAQIPGSPHALHSEPSATMLGLHSTSKAEDTMQ